MLCTPPVYFWYVKYTEQTGNKSEIAVSKISEISVEVRKAVELENLVTSEMRGKACNFAIGDPRSRRRTRNSEHEDRRTVETAISKTNHLQTEDVGMCMGSA